jgi:sugar phosphate isomerase/epimerase
VTATVEFGLSTGMMKGDLTRLPLLDRFEASHVEVGFLRPAPLEVVMEAVRASGRTFGFHDPLPWHPRWRWPSLTAPDPVEQARSLGVMRHTLRTVASHGAGYALTHFPSVHFAPVDGWSRARALASAHEAAATLARWGDELDIPILLENVGPNPYWDAAAWVEIFETYPRLGFCLDVGHLHLETRGDHGADVAFAAALAPFTRQMHIYNATEAAYREWHHVPAHPEQDPRAGWIDLPAVLETVIAGRDGPLCLIFEHTPEYPVDADYVVEGMAWVRAVAGAVAMGAPAAPDPRSG